MVSGVRYIANSPSIRIVLARTLVTGLIGGSVSALMPLVARDLLHGGAQTYGIMLGAFGMGAVIGALNIAEVRKRMSGEAAVRACALSMGGAIAAIALSREPVLTAAALVRRRRGVDAGGGAVQYRRAALGAALGRGPLAGGVPGLDCRRHRDRKLGLGPSHRRLPASRPRCWFPPALMLLSPLLGMLAADAAGRRAQRGRRSAGRSRGAAVADGAQRAAGGRDRIPRRAGQRARLPQRDAGSAAQPPAQRRLWLVDRARHRRSRIVDRALSLPDLARLSAPAQPRDPVRTRAASARRSTFTSAPSRCASAACWSGRSDRCAGRKRRRTAPPTRCCRWSRPRRAAVRRPYCP